MVTQTTQSDSKTLLTREQAADYLGVAPQTLAAWASAGRYDLPLVRAGGTSPFGQRDLEAWLESRSGAPVAKVKAEAE